MDYNCVVRYSSTCDTGSPQIFKLNIFCSHITSSFFISVMKFYYLRFFLLNGHTLTHDDA